MKRDNKKLIIFLGILFLAVILAYRLPQRSYSIIENIIPPIRSGDSRSVFYPSSMIILALVIIGIIGIANLKRFEDRSKSLIFIVIVVALIPLMNLALDITRSNYHWIKDDGLRAIDIEKSNFNFAGSDNKLEINLELQLKDYSKDGSEFKLRVYLPDRLSAYTGEDVYEFDNIYSTHGRRHSYDIKGEIVIEPISDRDREELFMYRWYGEDIEYELYNDEESIKIIYPRN